MSTTVLITGGAGYIGSILCETLLDRGFRTIVIDRNGHNEQSLFHLCSNPNFEFTLGDVRDERVLKRAITEADVIVPLAAVVGAPACDHDPYLARSVNLDAIRLLLRLRSPRQLVVFPTTNSGYGTKSGDSFCTEETALEPISLYGRTKVEAEASVLDSANAVTFRLATVFGASPRMRFDLLVNHFTREAVTRKTLTLFEQDFKRNFVHIRDVADCFVFAIEASESLVGKPYNLGLDSANLSKRELAERIKRHVRDLVILASDQGSDPDKRNYIVSNDRLRRAGFEAKRSLDDGIKELIKATRLAGRERFTNV